MRKRTRLTILASSTMVLAGASLSEPANAYASTCTDYCYNSFQYCMWTSQPGDSDICWDRLDRCLANCPA